MADPFNVIEIDGRKDVTVEWGAQLGRLAEGYARGGDHLPGKIRLSGGQTSNSLRNAVLHETIHELWTAAGLEQWLSQKTEELVVDALSAWLIDTLRRNPALVAFLMEGVEVDL